MIWRSGGALLALQAPEIHLKTGKSSHLAIRRGEDEVSFQTAKSAFLEANIDTSQVEQRSPTPSAAPLTDKHSARCATCRRMCDCDRFTQRGFRHARDPADKGLHVPQAAGNWRAVQISFGVSGDQCGKTPVLARCGSTIFSTASRAALPICPRHCRRSVSCSDIALSKAPRATPP